MYITRKKRCKVVSRQGGKHAVDTTGKRVATYKEKHLMLFFMNSTDAKPPGGRIVPHRKRGQTSLWLIRVKITFSPAEH